MLQEDDIKTLIVDMEALINESGDVIQFLSDTNFPKIEEYEPYKIMNPLMTLLLKNNIEMQRVLEDFLLKAK